MIMDEEVGLFEDLPGDLEQTIEPQLLSDNLDDLDDLTVIDDITTNDDNSLIDLWFEKRGLNKEKLTVLNENNEEEELNFNNLSKEEQLEFLSAQPEFQEPIVNSDELDEAEINFLNLCRENNLTPEEYIKQYQAQTTTPDYDVDSYNDQELFLLDLKNKYDLTEDELQLELEKELQNETLFKKKTEAIRNEYKQLEDQYKETQRIENERIAEEQYQQFSDKMVDIAVKTPEFYGIELEDDEKNEVLSFLLDVNDAGESKFGQALNDPAKLYEAAWFLRYGKDAFEALKNAYESEISKLKRK